MTKKSEYQDPDPEVPEDHSRITLMNLKELIGDKTEVAHRNMNLDTCKKISDLINEMLENKGEPLNGIRTLDGMTTYPCPKHEYAPISECLKCVHWVGKDNAGVCICKEKRIPGHKQFSHLEARNKEIEARRTKSAQHEKIKGSISSLGMDDSGKKQA